MHRAEVYFNRAIETGERLPCLPELPRLSINGAEPMNHVRQIALTELVRMGAAPAGGGRKYGPLLREIPDVERLSRCVGKCGAHGTAVALYLAEPEIKREEGPVSRLYRIFPDMMLVALLAACGAADFGGGR